MNHRAIVPTPFYNRERELEAFQRAYERPGQGAMALLYGRRRLGKTYLLQRFLAGAQSGTSGQPHAYYLTGPAVKNRSSTRTPVTHGIEFLRWMAFGRVSACADTNGDQNYESRPSGYLADQTTPAQQRLALAAIVLGGPPKSRSHY
jgi:hypothetical protein